MMRRSFSAEASYRQRERRFDDAVALRRPDRVPVVPFAEFFMSKYQGLTNKEALYDYELMTEAWKKTVIEFDWDMAPIPLSMLPGPAMDALGITQYRWPGGDLDDNLPYQFVEGEYLQADEYDDFLSNPELFTLRKLLPRFAEAMRPLAVLPPLYLMNSSLSLLLYGMTIAAMPSMQRLFGALLAAGDEVRRWLAAQAKLKGDLRELGYPLIAESICSVPFDMVTDTLRGMRGVMLDMYRQPDKLLAAIEFFTPLAIRTGVEQAKRTGNPRVFMALHRGSGVFMSNEQYARFYWPGLKEMMLAQIDAGLTPMPFFEGDYTSRLEFLREMPKGKVCACFDAVDIEKARDAIGDTMCFMGNVPAQLLIAGTAQEVRDYVKMLIDTFGENGGLIINGAASGIPEEARPENVRAITEAVYEYGVYG
jgi:uroporphyrinogen-III decarboxylase